MTVNEFPTIGFAQEQHSYPVISCRLLCLTWDLKSNALYLYNITHIFIRVTDYALDGI